ncbi:hypothetical protein [Streptomyces sp. NPDC058695]
MNSDVPTSEATPGGGHGPALPGTGQVEGEQPGQHLIPGAPPPT